jgi:LysM domain
MPSNYKVRQGDHLSDIATALGFSSYETIWNHPKNAKLKQKRVNPNVLFPGDTLFIPDKVQGEYDRIFPRKDRWRGRRCIGIQRRRISMRPSDTDRCRLAARRRINRRREQRARPIRMSCYILQTADPKNRRSFSFIGGLNPLLVSLRPAIPLSPSKREAERCWTVRRYSGFRHRLHKSPRDCMIPPGSLNS